MRIRTWMGAYAQVLTAMTGGVRLLLVHEAPSWHQSTPNACPFDDFFTCDRGTTPILLLRAGIYRPIATQLRAQPLRTASLVALVQQIGTKDAHKRTPNEMLRTRQLEVVRAMTQRISLREASRLGDDTEENSVVAVIETGISHMLGFMELGSMKLGSMKLGGAAPAQEQTPLRERERIVHSFHGHGTVISSVHGIVKVRFDEPKRTKWYRRSLHYKLHRPASCDRSSLHSGSLDSPDRGSPSESLDSFSRGSPTARFPEIRTESLDSFARVAEIV